MKSVLQAIVVVLVIHALGLFGVIGWLAGTGRLSNARLAEVRQVFAVSVEAEAKQAELAAIAAEAKAEEELEKARDAGLMPISVADRLESEQERNEMLLRQLERTRREIKALSQNLNLSRQRMEKEREETAAVRDELLQKVADIEARLNSDGFKRSVALYESLPAKQVKRMFIGLMSQNKTDQVVAYLEAMDERKAAGVLKEFKEDAEIARAVELTERLRARGSDLIDNAIDSETL